MRFARKCLKKAVCGCVESVNTKQHKNVICMIMLRENTFNMVDISVIIVKKYWRLKLLFAATWIVFTSSWNDKFIIQNVPFTGIEDEISTKMFKVGSLWKCSVCNHQATQKCHMYNHVEGKHIQHAGYQCNLCAKILKTKVSLQVHVNNYHKK